MRTTATIVVSAVLLALGLMLVPTSAEGGDVARVTYWTVRDGHADDFEAGLKAHNGFHARHNDPQALLTWEIVTGKRAGQYIRASFDHEWADFDAAGEMVEADDADAAANVDPHIAASQPVIAVALRDLTNPGDGPPFALSRVIYFHVRPGKQRQFLEAVGKIHAALSKVEGGWPAYFWYEIVDGGTIPTYVVSLGRKSWADFDPGDKNMAAVISAEYGAEGTAELFAAIGDAVEHEHSYTAAFRADLSYLPAAPE